MKNVLVITGSPRQEGNSDMLAEAFIRGTRAAGHEVTRFDAGRRNMQGCTACDGCFSTGEACCFDDGFNELAVLYECADAVVFVTPLYWYTFPAQIKVAIDKLYAFIVGQRQLKVKECVLIACGEIGDDSAFDGLVRTFQAIAQDRQWADRGHLIVHGVLHKGDVRGTDGLERAEAFGRSI